MERRQTARITGLALFGRLGTNRRPNVIAQSARLSDLTMGGKVPRTGLGQEKFHVCQVDLPS